MERNKLEYLSFDEKVEILQSYIRDLDDIALDGLLIEYLDYEYENQKDENDDTQN